MPIRRAAPSDARGIAEVHIASWQSAYRGLFPDDVLDNLFVESTERHWEKRLAGTSGTLVYEQDGRIVGFVGYEASRDEDADEEVGEVSTIYLAPDAWGKGIGRALLEQALASLQAAGYREVTLWVLKKNHRAIRFYEAAGFRPDGAAKSVSRFGAEHDELRYRRSL